MASAPPPMATRPRPRTAIPAIAAPPRPPLLAPPPAAAAEARDGFVALALTPLHRSAVAVLAEAAGALLLALEGALLFADDGVLLLLLAALLARAAGVGAGAVELANTD